VEVLNWIAHGYSSPEIANGLGITEPTVRKYLSITFQRLGARNRAHAVHLAERLGLISDAVPGGPMLTYVIGDATAPQGEGSKIIAHVCNDVGVWGTGFVLALSRRWSQPEDQYRLWWRHRDDFPFELGRIQLVAVEPGPAYDPNTYMWVANMVAQHSYSTPDEPAIRYDALETCLSKLANTIWASATSMADASVHMPRIGCGLAGGRWEDIEPIIKRTLGASGVSTYVYDLP
jgi:DNA-binding CsgD family transcriptional regulator/O-acetyl-ADP-ribose deacetylase (regulator of RNase III)